MATKPCNKCGVVKPLDGFPVRKDGAQGRAAVCRLCKKNKDKQYYETNKDKILAQVKAYYINNHEDEYRKKREYRLNNTHRLNSNRRNNEERRSRTRLRAKERRRTDEAYRFLENARSRIRHALKGRGAKSASTLELIGCSGEELARYLETTKVPGKDYTICHVDHIIPCAAFDMKIPEHQRVCFHWSNLQLLPGHENTSKNDKIPDWAQDILDCGGTILDAGDLQREIIQDARIIL